jgi:hypothetical protein
VSPFACQIIVAKHTFSSSDSGSSLIGSEEEKVRWFVLINGKMRCLEIISEDNL